MSGFERLQEASHYFAILLRRRPDFAEWLFAGRQIQRRYPLTELYQELKTAVEGMMSFSEVLVAFREVKQRHFLRIGARDLLGLADLMETTSQLSDLACVALQVGMDTLADHPRWWLGGGYDELWEAWREGSRLIVMGLGKLGGQELNYVSDVDLLFLEASHAETPLEEPADRVVVSRLCQMLSRLLSESVEGDRVFQVDLRLRPQGKDGTLVPPLSAAADYYLNCGRPWERQMLLKARPVAGDRSLGMSFLHEVRPFVFRRFLDFQALDELRGMRDRILAEGVRPTPGWKRFDVKLGVGGIREVEFLVQSLQLIYGGRHPELDEPNTLRCLDRLQDLNLLTRDVAEELKESYAFLRRVEHWVQLDENRQTQKLPQSPEGRQRLAGALGFERYEEDFLPRLEECCTAVHQRFLDLFHSEGAKRSLAVLKEEQHSEEPQIASLETAYSPEMLSGFQGRLEPFPSLLRDRALKVLGVFARSPHREVREKALVRLDRYLSQVARRPGLARLLRTAPPWLEDVFLGIARSEMLGDLLSHHPSLVEGIASGSGTCPDHETWAGAGVRLMSRVENYEEGLEWIRRLKNERTLQLALADLRGELECVELEESLSAAADFVIVSTFEHVKKHLGLPVDLPVSVLGMGRLGSREMSYLSDLDLVFVYRPGGGSPEQDIPSDVIRLIQRFMRLLSTPLQEGPGYPVDARLRPTGNYGPLVVTGNSWLTYYTEEADIWEIQALLRVRCIAGDRSLGEWIEKRAEEICYRERNPSEVWGRLCHLRRRMEKERAEEKGDALDIKLGMGGLVDLEFLAQGRQLIDGWRNDDLRRRSVQAVLPFVLEDNGTVGAAAKVAGKAFKQLRSLQHRLRLFTNLPSSRLSPDQFDALKEFGLWPPAKEEAVLEFWEDLVRMRKRVRSILREVCPEL